MGQPGDLGWAVMAHGDLCPAELGWDAASGALAARIVAGYAASHDAAREAAWIAEADGRRAGCVSCVAADEATAQLRILLVEPPARGHHLGGPLAGECDRCPAGRLRTDEAVDQPSCRRRGPRLPVALDRAGGAVTRRPQRMR